jgi:hypothetical protein
LQDKKQKIVLAKL